MPKSAMIRARIEPELKQEVETIFEALGLNATEALSLFYNQVKLHKGIPFEVSLPSEVKPSALANQSFRALIKKSKAMTPEQRLKAFVEHSFQLDKIHRAGQKNRRGT